MVKANLCLGILRCRTLAVNIVIFLSNDKKLRKATFYVVLFLICIVVHILQLVSCRNIANELLFEIYGII